MIYINKKTTNKNKGGTSMIKTCYLLKEKLTNGVYEYDCKMDKKNGSTSIIALPNR